MASVPNPANLAAQTSLKATLGRERDAPGGGLGLASATATLIGPAAAPMPPAPLELDETVIGEASAMLALANASLDERRRTVLPRRTRAEAETVGVPERPRFDRVRVLGSGAVGEVELARDNDIRRTVAVKRLKDDASSHAALLRFADEVRIVGQLEHPSIVPIYDVGRDETGKIYLVMKHLHGQTMEQIIELLRSGDPVAIEKYPITQRVHLFLGVLDAIRYAHARGVIHRDLKPANIMIGPYGEVTVLDWGIAKPIERKQPPSGAEALDRTAIESADTRLLETRLGSLAGTPLYMSPEQAAGRNDELDERSDVYSLCVVLYEWLTLKHPLAHKKTVMEVLAAIISEDYKYVPQFRDAASESEVPAEYLQLLFRGLVRDRNKRFQSAGELEAEIQKLLAGYVPIRCHVTLAKRTAYGVMHWIDRHPGIYTLLFLLFALSALGGVVYALVRAAQAIF